MTYISIYFLSCYFSHGFYSIYYFAKNLLQRYFGIVQSIFTMRINLNYWE